MPITSLEAAGDWIGPDEAARLMGVGRDLVRTLADSGELPCFRTPGGHRRFRRGDVERFIEERTHAGEVLG